VRNVRSVIQGRSDIFRNQWNVRCLCSFPLA